MTRPTRSDLKAEFLEVRRVLDNVWNPLGAGGWPEDEYESYVWPIVRLLREGALDEELADHFKYLEAHYFGRDADAPHTRSVIAALRELGIGKAGEHT